MQRQDKQRQAPDSLAPIQLERMSVEEQALVSGRGRSRGLVPLVAFAGVALALGVMLYQRLEANESLGNAGSAVKQMKVQDFDVFARCVFPGMDGTRIKDDDHLRTTIERHSQRHGRHYGQMVKTCARPLYDLQVGLERLQVPQPLEGARAEMQQSAQRLVTATSNYAAYLEAGDGYEFVTAQPKIEALALAWQDFQGTYRAFNDGLQAAVY